MRKFIVIFILIYGSFLYAQPECSANSTDEFVACLSSVDDGGTIKVGFNSSGYELNLSNKPFNINKDMTIEGTTDNVRFYSNNIVSSLNFMFVINAKNVTFKNFTIRTGIRPIKINSNGNYNFIDIKIDKEANGKAIMETNSTVESINIQDSNFATSGGTAFGLDVKAKSLDINNSTISVAEDALKIEQAENLSITHSTISSNIGYGINANAKNVDINSSSISSRYYGITVKNGENLNIIGNSNITSRGGNAIGGASNAIDVTNINIYYSTIKGVSRALNINSAKNLTIRGTTLEATGTDVAISSTNNELDSIDIQKSKISCVAGSGINIKAENTNIENSRVFALREALHLYNKGESLNIIDSKLNANGAQTTVVVDELLKNALIQGSLITSPAGWAVDMRSTNTTINNSTITALNIPLRVQEGDILNINGSSLSNIGGTETLLTDEYMSSIDISDSKIVTGLHGIIINEAGSVSMENTDVNITKTTAATGIGVFVKESNDVSIENSNITAVLNGIGIEKADSVFIMNTDVKVLLGGIDGHISGKDTAAINLQDVRDAKILGGKITGTDTAAVDARGIEIGEKAQNVLMDRICVYNGYHNVGINTQSSHVVKVLNSNFQDYYPSPIIELTRDFWYGDNLNMDITQSCLYGTRPLRYMDKNGHNANNSFNGNYWEDVNVSREIDNAPLSACPNANICYIENRFIARDTFRAKDNEQISTKIVKKLFDLNVSSFDALRGTPLNFRGTVCTAIVNSDDKIISNYHRTYLDKEDSFIGTYQANKATRSARLFVSWVKDKNVTCPMDTNTSNGSTIEGDNFAIKPRRFSIALEDEAKAGRDVDIKFSGLNEKNKRTENYNETEGATFKVLHNELKSECENGDFNASMDHWKFVNGEKIVTTKYSEIGQVDVNISDEELACKNIFASVDCKDKNVNGHWNSGVSGVNGPYIGKASKSIKFTLDHFDINATLKNFEDQKFTYLSNPATDENMSMAAVLDINISAKNGDGNVTKNYDLNCYAKDYDMNISYDYTALTPKDQISTIYFLETNSSKETNTTIEDKKVEFEDMVKEAFAKGEAHLHTKINFDRNYTKPLNPFDLNITGINIQDTDDVGDTNSTLDGNATFFYGRLATQDITTQITDIQEDVTYEIYDTTASKPFIQNSLYWFKNGWHEGADGRKFADIQVLNATTFDANMSTQTYKNKKLKFDKDLVEDPDRGRQAIPMVLANPESPENITVHVKIEPWLWHTYSTTPKAYSYETGTTCLEHNCFNIFYSRPGDELLSGEVNASDVTLPNESDQTMKNGVKVFR